MRGWEILREGYTGGFEVGGDGRIDVEVLRIAPVGCLIDMTSSSRKIRSSRKVRLLSEANT